MFLVLTKVYTLFLFGEEWNYVHKYFFYPIEVKTMKKTSRNCSYILKALPYLTGMSRYSFSLQVTYGFEKSALNWKREQTNDK